MFLFCLVLAMFCARLFICALWSPAGKGLTSWLSFVVSSVSLSLSHGILGQVWYLIVSIPDLCNLITLADIQSNLHGHADWSAILFYVFPFSKVSLFASPPICFVSFLSLFACKHARIGASKTRNL